MELLVAVAAAAKVTFLGAASMVTGSGQYRPRMEGRKKVKWSKRFTVELHWSVCQATRQNYMPCVVKL